MGLAGWQKPAMDWLAMMRLGQEEFLSIERQNDRSTFGQI
jgi:hypothetical protein